MRTFPQTRQRVFALFSGHQQPDLPSYTVDGAPKELLVDEYHTTKRSCRAPYEVLGAPRRTLPGGRIITDRDGRLCSSGPTLGSPP